MRPIVSVIQQPVALQKGSVVNGPPNPFDDLESTLNWFRTTLRPESIGGEGARAHLFTINGLTYPFVRHYNFAAVPDPPQDRRYDMYSGLHLARADDLLFFFQADPQAPGHDIDARRGIRGVYRVASTPFRAPDTVRDEVSRIGYQLLHACPNCGTPHATFADSCKECDTDFPRVEICGGEEEPRTRLLSSQMRIEPLLVFERSVSDERVFGDLSTDNLIWIGRHDNAQGPGKGSSIRQLLPEEAVKLVELLATEPDQVVSEGSDRTRQEGDQLAHSNGLSIELLPTRDSGRVSREDELYFLITEQLHSAGSNLRQTLDPHLPAGLDWSDLEYASSTFPWGYTAGEADFVAFFRDDRGRRSLVLIECKRGRAHDRAVLQAVLYAERILQVAFLTAPEDAHPRQEEPVEILPVALAEDATRPRVDDDRVAIPEPFELERSYFGGAEISARVRSPRFLRYQPPPPEDPGGASHRPLSEFDFDELPEERVKQIAWEPHRGAVGTATEMDWILENTWAEARRTAGEHQELL